MTSNLAILVVGGGAIAGFVSGLAGFAFGLIAMVFWAWTLPPQIIGPMLVVGSLTGQLLTIGTVRRSIRVKLIAPLIVGGLIGVPIGATLLPFLDPVPFRIGVGTLLVMYCGVMLMASNLPTIKAGGAFADALVGVIGGLLGGIAGLVGPAPTILCMLRGYPKDTQRAICQTFFIVMQSLTLVMYLHNGLINHEVLVLFAWMTPSSLLCAWLGSRLYVRLSDRAFRRTLLVLLFASGVALLGSSLRHAVQ